MKIYGVDAGGFDDCCTHALFSTREKAQQFADAFPSREDASVNEWEIDSIIPEISQGLKLFQIQMASDGTMVNIHQRSPYLCTTKFNKHNRCMLHSSSSSDKIPDGWNKVDNYNMYTGPGLLGSVWARDEEHAKELADDQRKILYDI